MHGKAKRKQIGFKKLPQFFSQRIWRPVICELSLTNTNSLFSCSFYLFIYFFPRTFRSVVALLLIPVRRPSRAVVSVQTQSARACLTRREPAAAPPAAVIDFCFPRRRLLFSFHPLSADGWAKWQIAPRARSLRGFRCQAFKRHRPPAPLQEWIPFKALAVFWLLFHSSVTIASLQRLQ